MKYTKEENKTLFIYSLKDVAQKEAVLHLSFFLRFISENIKSKSGKVRVAVINMAKWVINSLPQELNEKEERMICRFIDRMIDMTDEHYKDEFSKYKSIGDLPPSTYKSLKILVNRVILSREYYRNIYERHLNKMPLSMDCSWKRDPCGEDDCPVCSNRKDLKEAPVFQETFIYKMVKEWSDEVFTVVEDAEDEGDFWMFTRSACDLFWYSNVLLVKCSILTQSEPLSFENNYARYVIRECLRIIKRSLRDIISHDPISKGELRSLFFRISEIEKEILDL